MDSSKDRVKAQAYLPSQETLKTKVQESQGSFGLFKTIGGVLCYGFLCVSFFGVSESHTFYFTHNREPQGFAFVEFYEDYDARKAQEKLDREYINGRELTVIFAKVRFIYIRVGSSLMWTYFSHYCCFPICFFFFP